MNTYCDTCLNKDNASVLGWASLSSSQTIPNFSGMSTSQIVWAFHSDAETELLNALPCCQKGEENWEDLRAYGVAW